VSLGCQSTNERRIGQVNGNLEKKAGNEGNQVGVGFTLREYLRYIDIKDHNSAELTVPTASAQDKKPRP
jgi:hypothetical protein